MIWVHQAFQVQSHCQVLMPEAKELSYLRVRVSLEALNGFSWQLSPKKAGRSLALSI